MLQHIDHQRVRTSFAKSLYSYPQHAEVQTQMAENLLTLLRQRAAREFDAVLEIGCGAGVLTERFLKTYRVAHFDANDLVPTCAEVVTGICKQYLAPAQFRFLAGDIERLDLPAPLDLIISNATFQWLTDLNTFLPRLKRTLKPGGLLAFSTFGPENLREIRALTGNGLDYLPVERLARLLHAHFEVLTCSAEVVTLDFPTPHQALRHLRLTGVNGASRQQWTKAKMFAFERSYREQFGHANGVPLTYQPILCIAKNRVEV